MEGTQIAIIILIICVLLALISKTIQRKFIDKEKMNSLKSQIKTRQTEMKESISKGDDKEKIASMQKEMMDLNMQMMSATNKVMLVSLPIFLVFFAGLGYFFGGMSFQSLIPLPEFNNWSIINPMSWMPVGVTMTTGYYKAYFFYYLISTIVITIIEKIVDKYYLKK